MNLLLDAGNSRLKWGLHDGRDWIADGALDYAQLPALAEQCRVGEPLRRILGVNVAGAELAARIERALAGLGRVDWNRARSAQAGVRNGYREPAQLGADRWAALIGAHHLHRGAALVVMAGTATTIDLLAGDGLFRGGVILPGLDLMRRALARDTAQLPYARGAYRQLPASTEDAILSGCCDAQAGAIERLFRRLADEPGALCLLGGGGAAVLEDLLEVPVRRVDRLVLEGLARIAGEADATD